MKATKLFHISDIHIGSNPARRNEYHRAFTTLAGVLAEKGDPSADAVVITGDVFHHKVKYGGEDVQDFGRLLDILVGWTVIIIPGNHDVNLNNENSTDLIGPLIGGRHGIHYLAAGGKYTISIGGRQIDFVHIGMRNPAADLVHIATPLVDNPRVLLYHGLVDGAKFGKHVSSGRVVTKEIMDRATLALLGDIHEAQFVLPHAGYAGSLIRQNQSECFDKGIIIWDMGTRTGVRHLVSGGDNVANEQRPPEMSAVDTIVTETIRELLTGTPEHLAEQVIQLHAAGQRPRPSAWYIKSMTWRTMFKYGDDNHIDFDPINGSVTAIVANNRAGKSSIIDILVYGLFNILLRGTKQSILRKGAAEFELDIIFVVAGTQYRIHRRDDVKHCTIRLWKNVINPTGEPDWQNITRKDVADTYADIRLLIGDVDQFRNVALYYDASGDIVRSGAARVDLICSVFGVTTALNGRPLESKIRALKEEIKKLGPGPSRQTGLLITADMVAAQVSLCDKLSEEYHSARARAHSVRTPTINLMTAQSELSKVEAEIARLEQLSATRVSLQAELNRPKDCPDVEHIRQALISLGPAQPASGDYDQLTARAAAIKQELIDLGSPNISQFDIDTAMNQLAAAQGSPQFDSIAATVKLSYRATVLCLTHSIIGLRLKMATPNQAREKLAEELAAAETAAAAHDLRRREIEGQIARAERELTGLAEAIARRSQLRAIVDEWAASENIPVELYREQAANLFARYSEATAKLGALKAALVQQQEAEKMAKLYDERYPALRAQLDVYEKYDAIINGRDLKAAIVRRCVDDLFADMNATLSAITDFTLSYTIAAGKLDIFMTENNGPARAPLVLPIEMASGFQRFAAALVFRVGLNRIANCRAEFLIIDEGLGCVDEVHVSRLMDFLECLRRQYRYIIIATHITNLPCVRNRVEVREVVTEGGVCSRVNTRPPNDPVEAAPLPAQAQPAVAQVVAVQGTARIKCECGAMIAPSGMSRHVKTTRHQKKLA